MEQIIAKAGLTTNYLGSLFSTSLVPARAQYDVDGGESSQSPDAGK